MSAQLTITGMQVHLLEIPTHAVHRHGSGDIGTIRTLILELTTDAGVTGWGEASPWPVFTGTLEASAGALHQHFRPLVLGANPCSVEAILFRAESLVVHCPEAKAALEMALLDIIGKTLHVPVHVLLGGSHRERIPLSFSVANADFDADLAMIERLYADGVRILKLKTGFSDHGFDVMRLQTLRERYGDEMLLRADYNQGMHPYDAIRTLRDIEAFKPCFIEQPVPRADLNAMANIKRAIDTPLMADESVFNARDALAAVALDVADIFALKVMKSGGLRRAMEVAAIARAAGIAVYGGCMFETGVAHAAGAHLMAALPELQLGCEFYMANYYLVEDILCEPFPVRDGYVHPPTTPGLGINIDVDVLRKYRFELLS